MITHRVTLHSRLLNESLKVCNCASCSKLLLGSCHEEHLRIARRLGDDLRDIPPLVAGRIKGRPYCGNCLNFIDSGDLLTADLN